jgi:hypothetical protein
MLYHIIYESEPRFVEADSLADAVYTWREHLKQEGDRDGTQDPDSIVKLSDDPVIRMNELGQLDD